MKINNHIVKNKESAFNSKKSEKPPFCFFFCQLLAGVLLHICGLCTLESLHLKCILQQKSEQFYMNFKV